MLDQDQNHQLNGHSSDPKASNGSEWHKPQTSWETLEKRLESWEMEEQKKREQAAFHKKCIALFQLRAIFKKIIKNK